MPSDQYPPDSILGGMDHPLPVFDQHRAEHALQDLEAAARSLDDPALSEMLGQDLPRKFLTGVFGNSPYLTRTALRFPQGLPTLLCHAPDKVLDQILEDLLVSAVEDGEVMALMPTLRQAKAKTALLVAFADIAGVWDLSQVTGALTKLADTCLQACVRRLLRTAHEAGKVTLARPDEPETQSGLAILAMGKYGAGELNYSSDIDITVYYDAEVLPVTDPLDAQPFCVKLTKDIVKLMQDNTGDGYVFRTDLRLRPDAGATAVAMSMTAAEQYYESMGQNWERAAMIKARAAAGDIPAGEAFLKNLEPFVWRKYLDYAAIEDIHSIKRQIHSNIKFKTIQVAGHNVKLGLGGFGKLSFLCKPSS